MLILLITIILTSVNLSECLSALLRERKDEFSMYRSIGWRKKWIMRRVLKETSSFSAIGIFLGVVTAIITFLSLAVAINWILLVCIVGLVLHATLIFGVVRLRNYDF